MKSSLQSIPFSLVKVSDKLTKDANHYRARVKSRGTYDLEDVCKAMAKRIHDENNASTCQFFVNLFESTVRDLTMQGYRVKTGLIETGLSIFGSFDNADDEYDAKRHEISPTISATKSFKAAVAGAEATNRLKHLPRAKIGSLMDAVTHRLNEIVIGHEIHIQGLNLGIDPDNPDEGVFLENAKGVYVASATVLKSDVQTINCRFVDPIPSGSYTLRVACRSGATADIRPAEASLPDVVVVKDEAQNHDIFDSRRLAK